MTSRDPRPVDRRGWLILGALCLAAVVCSDPTQAGRGAQLEHAGLLLARELEREAQLLAALNHPNIAIIHGLEASDGLHYLVLELVPGDPLFDEQEPANHMFNVTAGTMKVYKLLPDGRRQITGFLQYRP